MKINDRSNLQINVVIILLSLLSWFFLLFDQGNVFFVVKACISNPYNTASPNGGAVNFSSLSYSFQEVILYWLFMIIAMMLPKLISPIKHIYSVSFREKRFVLSTIFVLTYLTVWLFVGVSINLMMTYFKLYLPYYDYLVILLLVLTIVYQFSPLKQKMLNRGHNHLMIAAFGWKSYIDVIRFGIFHAFWCVCAGVLIMLFPMLLPKGHDWGMLLATLIMFSEHLEEPRIPCWQINLRLKALRILYYKIKLENRIL